ncbi:MAG: hypothetical protein H7A55_15125 [Verrucomicrobiaceae bacterium]|nr:hypothetical protein [Verrucomicrobiaceae bacterium]
MIGCYDFCGHYEWTFEWLREMGGDELVKQYWDEAIHQDSQRHAGEMIVNEGIEGMKKYWAHTLEEEAAGFICTSSDKFYRIDMHACPSKGFLIQNGLEQYRDYCDHCIGWIGPLMKRAGFVIDHQHNHCGQCWWEMRRTEDAAVPATRPADDVRLRADWKMPGAMIDSYVHATNVDQKEVLPPEA